MVPRSCRRDLMPSFMGTWSSLKRKPVAAVPISVTGPISSRIKVCASRGASVAFRSELSTPFSLVLVGCPTGCGLRLHADELEAEIAQPVEESVKL